MGDRLQDLALFVRVAETASFSRAGRDLGLAQPTVSRLMAGLEDRLGVKLLLRTTRRVTLTDAGALLAERARALLAEVDALEQAVRGSTDLVGTLRVATPVTFAAREIVPRLGGCLAAHPGLRVDLLMSDRRIDLLDEGVDLAIRMGTLEPSSFIARRLGSGPRLIVASPDYLARRGRPGVPADLPGHDVILGQQPGTATWTLTAPDGAKAEIAVSARLTATAIEGVIAAALAGFGLAAVSAFACRAELASGALAVVLPDHRLSPVDVHAILPAGRRLPPRARAFLDHLAEGLAAAW